MLFAGKSLMRTARQRSLVRLGVAGCSVAGLLLAWEALSRFDVIDTTYLGSPYGVALAGWELVVDGSLWQHGSVSLYAFVVGFAIASLGGVPLGLMMGWNRTIREVTEPLVMALNATPRLTLLPVIIVWLGIGTGSTILVVVLAASIPVVVNAMAGVAEADPGIVRASRSFSASRRQLFAKVLLPGALPSVIAGLRMGAVRGILGVVIAEMYVSVEGIGNIMSRYGNSFRTDYLFFLVVLIALTGYGVSTLLRHLEQHYGQWKLS